MKIFRTVLLGSIAFYFLFIPCMGADIHKAAIEGDIAKVQALIAENPALTDAKDEMGRTPLAYAVSRGHKNVVELMIDKGADVNIQEKCSSS